MFSAGGLKATQACNWEKGHLDHRSCPFVFVFFKREKQSMGSIKQICERSKCFQSLLPAPKILALNDWMGTRDRGGGVIRWDGNHATHRNGPLFFCWISFKCSGNRGCTQTKGGTKIRITFVLIWAANWLWCDELERKGAAYRQASGSVFHPRRGFALRDNSRVGLSNFSTLFTHCLREY